MPDEQSEDHDVTALLTITDVPEPQLPAAMHLIPEEIGLVLEQVQLAQMAALCTALRTAERIFLAGAGRSGLALQMFAMRLMHLGLTVHVAGEVTAPALAKGDLLLIASASGTTSSTVHAADVAIKVGAAIFLITTARDSGLAEKSDGVLIVPAASKHDVSGQSSQQYAGSLFEQVVLLVLDAVFHTLWQGSQQTAEQLLHRHANLE